MISHAIKVLDTQRTASFWYIRSQCESIVDQAAIDCDLEIEKLKTLSKKLRIVRNNTHFHIDIKFGKSPEEVWKTAEITGSEFSDLLKKLHTTIALTKQNLFGGALALVTIYEGKDVAKIIRAYEEIHEKVHGER